MSSKHLISISWLLAYIIQLFVAFLTMSNLGPPSCKAQGDTIHVEFYKNDLFWSWGMQRFYDFNQEDCEFFEG